MDDLLEVCFEAKQTGVEGLTLNEANAINLSLSVFGRVVEALSVNTLPPWRENLGGQSSLSLNLCGYTPMEALR